MPRPFICGAAALALTMASATAQTDQAEIVETHSDFEIVLSELDVVAAEDPTDQIMGITDQFLDGEPLLSELFLTEPMLRADIRALTEASETGTAAFRCREVILYLVNGWHVISGEACDLTTP